MSVEICDVTFRADDRPIDDLSDAWGALTLPPRGRLAGCPNVQVPWDSFIQAQAVKAAGTSDIVRTVSLPYPVRLFSRELALGRLLGTEEGDGGERGLYTGVMTLTLSDSRVKPMFLFLNDSSNPGSPGVANTVGWVGPCEPSSVCRMRLTLEGLTPLPKPLCPPEALGGAWSRRNRSGLQDLHGPPRAYHQPARPARAASWLVASLAPWTREDTWWGQAVAEFRDVFLLASD